MGKLELYEQNKKFISCLVASGRLKQAQTTGLAEIMANIEYDTRPPIPSLLPPRMLPLEELQYFLSFCCSAMPADSAAMITQAQLADAVTTLRLRAADAIDSLSTCVAGSKEDARKIRATTRAAINP